MARIGVSLARNEVVRKKVELPVLRAYAEGLKPGAIRQLLLAKHNTNISAGSIDTYIKRALEDPKMQAAMQIRMTRPTELSRSIKEYEDEIQRQTHVFLGLMEECRRRYADGITVIPGDIKTFLQNRGLTLTRSEWERLMGMMEQQSLDRAIVNMSRASAEARAWLEIYLRLKQLLPTGDTNIYLTQVNQMVNDILPLLCDPCQKKIAGLDKENDVKNAQVVEAAIIPTSEPSAEVSEASEELPPSGGLSP